MKLSFLKSFLSELLVALVIPLSSYGNIVLDHTEVRLGIGEGVKITATRPNTSTTQFAINVSNTDVVRKADQGDNYVVLLAVAEGTATITFKDYPSLKESATCKITVSGYAAGYDFSSNTQEGVSMSFEVNDDRKTCTVCRNAISKSTSGKVTIPQYVNGLRVTDIAAEAFKQCKDITSVVIPEGVTTIGDDAFYYCTSLTSVDLPSTVKKIGDWCFCGCEKLGNITGGFNNLEFAGSDAFSNTAWYDNLPNGILYLGKVLYRYKGYINSNITLDVREGTVMISEYAFSDCGNKFSLTIPKSVKYIQYNDKGTGFSGLGNCPQSITVDAENPVYDSREGCNAIIEKSTSTLLSASQSTSEIPSSVRVIWDNAFYRYLGSTITIPRNVVKIGNYAFYYSSIKKITIGSGVEEIGKYAFSRCSSLENISVSSANTYYDSRDNCNAIIEKSTGKLIVGCKNTLIPESVRIIGDGAFRDRSGITSIVIPDNVEEIEGSAFSEISSLENITFGKKVQKIGSYVVDRGKLKYIRVLSSAPCEIGNYTFSVDIFEEVPLYIPKGSLTSYKVATNWSKFNTIIEGEPPVPVTAITLSSNTLTLTAGDTSQLTAEFTPENATNKNVTWSSDNENVAMVSNTGLVTAKSAGSAAITCKAADESGITATCKVTVKTLSPTAISIPTSASVAIGSSITLTPTFTPANATASLTWTSYNKSVATVNNKGVVTGIAKGQTFITVKTDNGKSSDCIVTVTAPEPTSIALPESASLNVGETLKLTPTITPNNAETTLTWSSDDKSIATVNSDGVVTGVKKGLTFIYVKTSNGKTAVCKLTVNGPILVTAIKLNSNSQTLKAGETVQLTATITPENATNKTVTWSSNNEKVATVSSTGLVTAKSAGSATITCTTNDGSKISAKCTITVESANIKGDVNGDGEVNGTDLVALTNIILGRKENTEAADVNGDGEVNGTDYVTLVNIILGRHQALRKANTTTTTSLSIDSSFDIKAGQEKELLVNLTNPNDMITLVQFDLRLPSGLSLKQVDGEYEFDMAGRSTWRKHSLDVNDMNGIIRFILSSNSNAALSGTEGAIIKMTIKADDSFTNGDIQLENILMVSPDEKETKQGTYVYSIGTTEPPIQETTGLAFVTFDVDDDGDTELVIGLNNPDDEITLVQFDLSLPSGLTLKQTDGEFDIDIVGRTTWKKHSLDANATNGIIRFLLASGSNAILSGTEGAVIKMAVKTDKNFNSGTVKLDNILLVTPNEKEIKPSAISFIIDPVGVKTISADGSDRSTIYNLSGQRVVAPRKGINIIHYSDGTSSKVLIK